MEGEVERYRKIDKDIEIWIERGWEDDIVINKI